MVHEDAAPDNFAGLADAFHGSATETEIHWRLALADCARILANEVLGRHRARNFEQPDELANAIHRKRFAIPHVMQGGLRVVAGMRPDAGRPPRSQPRARGP